MGVVMKYEVDMQEFSIVGDTIRAFGGRGHPIKLISHSDLDGNEFYVELDFFETYSRTLRGEDTNYRLVEVSVTWIGVMLAFEGRDSEGNYDSQLIEYDFGKDTKIELEVSRGKGVSPDRYSISREGEYGSGNAIHPEVVWHRDLTTKTIAFIGDNRALIKDEMP